MKFLKSNPGIITVTAMMVVGFIAVGIVVFVLISNIDILQQGLYDTEYQETFVGADACVEEALLRLNSNNAFTGDTYAIGSISCIATVTNPGGNVRVIRAEATQGSTYISTFEVTVDVGTAPISVTNFEEVL